MKVNDIDISYQFYAKLGLRPFGRFPDLAIIELRGGTHILLLGKNDELPFSLSSSLLGQRGATARAVFLLRRNEENEETPKTPGGVRLSGCAPIAKKHEETFPATGPRRRDFAAAAADPNTPQVEVMCQPRA